ncbi:hypothetical protein L248_1160 [Schleiferilactobacillus shenzhenensis LY-73]|uniref:Uncharacterized protein n=1 Tax=Schleiferilactobacillus shenzhenensis LY-73 TaxID=1231336 RepID=U4TW50_9LACO|nr:hypothetical protein L248_1160 [Schleiferilactobacillus shenzhenensis LY-73]
MISVRTRIGGRWWAVLLYGLWRLWYAAVALIPVLEQIAKHPADWAAVARGGAVGGHVDLVPFISLTVLIVIPLRRPLADLATTAPPAAVWHQQAMFNGGIALLSSVLMSATALVRDPWTGQLRPGWTVPADILLYALGIAVWSWLFLMVADRVILQGGSAVSSQIVVALILISLLLSFGESMPASRSFSPLILNSVSTRFLAQVPWLFPLLGAVLVYPLMRWQKDRPLRILPAT